MPAILGFLGYNPLPEGQTWAERLVRRRAALGIAQEEAARPIGVDQATLAKWAQVKREPWGDFITRTGERQHDDTGRVVQSGRTGVGPQYPDILWNGGRRRNARIRGA